MKNVKEIGNIIAHDVRRYLLISLKVKSTTSKLSVLSNENVFVFVSFALTYKV